MTPPRIITDVDGLADWLRANPEHNTTGPITLLDGVENENYAALQEAWKRRAAVEGKSPMTIPDKIYAWPFMAGAKFERTKGGWNDTPGQDEVEYTRSDLVTGPHAEKFETLIDVMQDPNGAHMAIHAMAARIAQLEAALGLDEHTETTQEGTT